MRENSGNPRSEKRTAAPFSRKLQWEISSHRSMDRCGIELRNGFGWEKVWHQTLGGTKPA